MAKKWIKMEIKKRTVNNFIDVLKITSKYGYTFDILPYLNRHLAFLFVMSKKNVYGNYQPMNKSMLQRKTGISRSSDWVYKMKELGLIDKPKYVNSKGFVKDYHSKGYRKQQVGMYIITEKGLSLLKEIECYRNIISEFYISTHPKKYDYSNLINSL